MENDAAQVAPRAIPHGSKLQTVTTSGVELAQKSVEELHDEAKNCATLASQDLLAGAHGTWLNPKNYGRSGKSESCTPSLKSRAVPRETE